MQDQIHCSTPCIPEFLDHGPVQALSGLVHSGILSLHEMHLQVRVACNAAGLTGCTTQRGRHAPETFDSRFPSLVLGALLLVTIEAGHFSVAHVLLIYDICQRAHAYLRAGV